MTLTWNGSARPEEVVNLGPLALIHPLLQQLDLAAAPPQPRQITGVNQQSPLTVVRMDPMHKLWEKAVARL